MPLPFFAIAIPVLHSSGGWIASTAAAGYVSGTLSGTWIGTFVLGNSALLSSTGLISAAGIFGASGGLSALSASATSGVGWLLSTVGFGGVAQTLGIAPVTTFLGLTPVGWAIAGTVAAAGSAIAVVGLYFGRKTMKNLNEERQKGGLEPITISGIVKEVRLLESQSLHSILEKLASEGEDVSLMKGGTEAKIEGQIFSIGRLRYLIHPDGLEEIVFLTRTGRKRRVMLLRPRADIAAQSN